MIYSPDHKFLLLKNHKVGSSSLEVEVSCVVPENAIVTTLDPSNPRHFPRNYNGGFYHHMTYTEVSNKINLDDVKSYIFIRHPYSTVLSHFFYCLQLNNTKLHLNNLKNQVDDYFNSTSNKHWEKFLRSTKEIYTTNNENPKIMVSDVLRYELGIENEINKVLSVSGINNIKMNTFEKKYRPDHLTIHNVFNDDHLEKIYNEWSWEFKTFGYKE
jgi:hypothetical protein